MTREETLSKVFDLSAQGIGVEGIQEYLASQYDQHYSVYYIKGLLTKAIYKEENGLWGKDIHNEIKQSVRGV